MRVHALSALVAGATLSGLLAGCGADAKDDPRKLPPIVRVATAASVSEARHAYTGIEVGGPTAMAARPVAFKASDE